MQEDDLRACNKLFYQFCRGTVSSSINITECIWTSSTFVKPKGKDITNKIAQIMADVGSAQCCYTCIPATTTVKVPF
jgi:hypothetical protein